MDNILLDTVRLDRQRPRPSICYVHCYTSILRQDLRPSKGGKCSKIVMLSLCFLLDAMLWGSLLACPCCSPLIAMHGTPSLQRHSCCLLTLRVLFKKSSQALRAVLGEFRAHGSSAELWPAQLRMQDCLRLTMQESTRRARHYRTEVDLRYLLVAGLWCWRGTESLVACSQPCL